MILQNNVLHNNKRVSDYFLNFIHWRNLFKSMSPVDQNSSLQDILGAESVLTTLNFQVIFFFKFVFIWKFTIREIINEITENFFQGFCGTQFVYN